MSNQTLSKLSPSKMYRIKLLLLYSLATASLLMIPACAPHINNSGEWVVEPRLENGQYLTGDGLTLPVRSWKPEDGSTKAVVVALHGFNDYSNAFATPGSYLSRHGIACYAYDQRGFGNAPARGLWAGVDTYTRDLSNFIIEIRKKYPGIPLYVLGESMGGAVAIVALTGSDAPSVDGVILVAPAVWSRNTMPWYQRWMLAFTAHSVPWMQLTGDGLGVIPSDNIEMRRALGQDPLVIKATRIDAMYGLTNLMDEALSRADKLRFPTLVLYGKNDQVIPKEPTLLMIEKLPGTTRKAFYEHGYHLLLRDLQGFKPLADIVTWIIRPDYPLPFGIDHWD